MKKQDKILELKAFILVMAIIAAIFFFIHILVCFVYFEMFPIKWDVLRAIMGASFLILTVIYIGESLPKIENEKDEEPEMSEEMVFESWDVIKRWELVFIWKDEKLYSYWSITAEEILKKAKILQNNSHIQSKIYVKEDLKEWLYQILWVYEIDNTIYESQSIKPENRDDFHTVYGVPVVFYNTILPPSITEVEFSYIINNKDYILSVDHLQWKKFHEDV